MGEEVVEDNLHTILAGFHNHLDGIDAGAANLEEVVGGTHLFNIQHFREDAGKKRFRLAFRSHVFVDTLKFGDGQSLAVDLEVGSHWHHVETHIGVGHHVISQR